MKGGWKNSRKHRSSLSVMAEILEIAMNGALKTPIRYKANLSFGQFNEYLSLLLEVGLLEKTNNYEKAIYKTTAKGLQYIRSYKKITALLTEKGNVRGKEPLKMS